VGGQHHTLAALPLGKKPNTHCIGGWVGPRTGLDGCGKSCPTGIQSPDRLAHSESLYQPSYPCPHFSDRNHIHHTDFFTGFKLFFYLGGTIFHCLYLKHLYYSKTTTITRYFTCWATEDQQTGATRGAMGLLPGFNTQTTVQFCTVI
jgi:hypothetical protein